MSDWREDEEEQPAPQDWSDVKRYVLGGAAFAGLVILWMIFARPGEEAASTRGFNLGPEAGSSPSSSGKPFSPRPKTGLDMVSSEIGDGPESVKPANFLGSQEPAASATAPAAAANPAQASAPPASAAPAPQPPPASSPADDAKALASAGIPTDAKGLSRLGATDGLLTALTEKLLDHPNVLKAIFNNKTVVNAFMNRKGAKENCQSGGALKSYLSDSGSGGMNSVLPVIQKALGNPSTASGLVSALADTEMVKQASACPSLQELSKDPTAVMTIAMANPKALSIVMDPRGAAALASNPQASSALAAVQSKMGGAQ